MILKETIDLLKSNYKQQFENLTIKDLRIGLNLSAVQLSDDTFGIASTLSDSPFHCDKNIRDYGEFTPTKIKGRKVLDLLESEKTSNIIETLKIAVLNAISTNIISSSNYKVIENTDPVDLLNLDSQKNITIVGAFHSYIQLFMNTEHKLKVLELNENALTANHKEYYVPADEYSKVLPQSDVVIITGLTLVNNTLDGLLDHVSPNAQVIVTGPSSSIIPDILFRNKVSIIGATRITKPEVLFEVVEEGAAGFHLFNYCAEKICIVK